MTICKSIPPSVAGSWNCAIAVKDRGSHSHQEVRPEPEGYVQAKKWKAYKGGCQRELHLTSSQFHHNSGESGVVHFQSDLPDLRGTPPGWRNRDLEKCSPESCQRAPEHSSGSQENPAKKPQGHIISDRNNSCQHANQCQLDSKTCRQSCLCRLRLPVVKLQVQEDD